MKAGVIGTNWGRVHVDGFRKAGCDVIALMAAAPELVKHIAEEENIPHWGTSIDVLSDCEIVAIATPTHTHYEYLDALKDRIVLCEKPLGLKPDNLEKFRALNAPRAYISYPFPFTNTARQLQHIYQSGELGEILRITAITGVNLPYPKSPCEWFMEDMIHPYSLLTHLFGEMTFIDAFQGNGCNISARMRCQNALVDLLLSPLPKQGLHFDITIIGSKNTCQLRGGFRPDRQWWMEPLMLDDQAYGLGEPSEDSIWIRANHRVSEAMIAHQTGIMSDKEAKDVGLFPFDRALEMEASLLPLWIALSEFDQTPTLAGNMVWHTCVKP